MRALRAVFILLTLVAATATAELARAPRAIYDPATETTVRGTVVKVIHTAGRRAGAGMHLTLKTEDRTYDVHLGPAGYVRSQGFRFSVGDRIEVTGSELTLGGRPTILAREIRKRGHLLTLRDENGVPEWAGRGRRGW